MASLFDQLESEAFRKGMEMIKEEKAKIMVEKTVKRGSKITYMRHFAFGKKGEETARVVAIRGNDVLLDNGQELDLRDIKFNKKKYKIESVNESKEINIDEISKLITWWTRKIFISKRRFVKNLLFVFTIIFGIKAKKNPKTGIEKI